MHRNHRHILGLVLLLTLVYGCRADSNPPETVPDPLSRDVTPSLTIEAAQPSATHPPTSAPASGPVCPPESDVAAAIKNLQPGATIVEGFELQILAYLDQGGSAEALEDALNGLTLDGDGENWLAKSQVFRVDLTGDQVAEVLLDLVFYVPGQYSDGAVFIYRCENGRYTGGAVAAIGGAVLASEQAYPGGIRAVGEMNGDSIPEVVTSYVEVVGTHANYTRVFDIYSWDGVEFVEVSPRDSYGASMLRVQNGDGEIVDADEDGRFELVLTPGPGRGPDADPAQTLEKEIWGWDGEGFVLLQTEGLGRSLQCAPIPEPPVFRFQAFQFGDIASLCEDYESAQAYYQQAVFDEELLGWSPGRSMDDSAYAATPTPDPDERSKINAYGRYRILLLHVVRGYFSDAQVVYESLVEKVPTGSPGGEYTELANIFWNAYQQDEDLGAACEKATAYAASHDNRILKPLSAAYYGVYGLDYAPGDICPFK